MAGVVLPDMEGKAERGGCPKCGKRNFTGRNIQGTVLFTCRETGCGNQWQGGLGKYGPQQDPSKPRSPEPPAIRYNTEKMGEGNLFEEIRPRQDPRPDFRLGVPFPEDGEDV